MYNFINSKLCLTVSTDSAAMDNYEVENLINDNFLVKSRGFIAYSSIKPPVDVNFEFMCPVNIHYIVLSTCLGSQKTTGIEVLVKDSSNVSTSVGHSNYDESGVVFCNSRRYSRQKQPPFKESGFCLRYFKANTFRAFTNASVVTIRITRTDKSLPCLGRVEVWGEVAASCSDITRKTIDQIMNKSDAHVGTAVSISKLPVNKSCEQFEIPDDFKDALTFECMAVPMTLPSGHSVDRTTLEKHTENEAIYGRHATDPFTGLVFTDSRKPVLNVALKSRIDMFLLQNSHHPETFSIKRTLGGTSSNNKLLLTDNSCNKKIKLTKTDDDLMQEKNCVLCNSEHNLYVIPCKHLYCRKCLLELCINIKCCKCDKLFSKNNAYKIHL